MQFLGPNASMGDLGFMARELGWGGVEKEGVGGGHSPKTTKIALFLRFLHILYKHTVY